MRPQPPPAFPPPETAADCDFFRMLRVSALSADAARFEPPVSTAWSSDVGGYGLWWVITDGGCSGLSHTGGVNSTAWSSDVGGYRL